VHGARGNNPDQLAVAAQRETNVKQPSRIGLSESMQPDLIRTMSDIRYDQQRFVKENLLGFCLAHRMLVDAFAAVTCPRPEERAELASSQGVLRRYSICSKTAKRSRTSSSSSIEAAPAILTYRFSQDRLWT